MKIAIISPSTNSLESLGRILKQGNSARTVTIHNGGMSKLRAVADQDHPDIILLEGLFHDAADLNPVESVTTQYGNTYVILLCTQQSSDMLINAMRAGVREVLPSPVSQSVLEAAISRAEAKLGLKLAEHKAVVISFISCKGGSGATFLSTNIGCRLGEQGRKVLLIDLNLQFGEAAMTVYDRKASYDIVQVAHNIARLDATFLNALLEHVTPNFSILAAPDDPTLYQEVSPEHVDVILNVAITQFDFVLLDVRRNLDDIMIKALDRSDKIFLVVQTLLPYVRNANRMMAVFRSLGYQAEKIEVLVNRYWKNDEIGLNQLQTSIGKFKMHTIPNGYKEVAKAINLGLPLASVARSGVVFKAVCDIADSLQPRTNESQGGLLSRLLKQ